MTAKYLPYTLSFSLKLRELPFRIGHTTKKPHFPAYIAAGCGYWVGYGPVAEQESSLKPYYYFRNFL